LAGGTSFKSEPFKVAIYKRAFRQRRKESMHLKASYLLRAVLALNLLILLGVHAIAQNATGAITGSVTDPTGAVVAGASVLVTNKATGAARKVNTGSEGNYSIDTLLPGEYEVKVEAQGFTSQLQLLVIQVGNTTTGNFTLSVGGTAQTVEVVGGGAPVLNTTDSSLGGVVTQRQIESLPLNGRSFLSVAGLEPGVTVTYQATSGVLNQNDFFQVGIGGAPSYMTNITVDGSRANDRITGGTSQNFSSETVQEFQISTIGFDLSTGTVSAGAVNVVSRSGSNSYHGSAFLFFRDHNMAAFPGLTRNCLTDSVLCRNPESRKRLLDPFFVRRQYGGTVGGPIKKNKLFFFANYERSDQVGAQPINFTDPLLSGFNHIGSVPFDQHLIGARMDYKVNDQHTAFLDRVEQLLISNSVRADQHPDAQTGERFPLRLLLLQKPSRPSEPISLRESGERPQFLLRGRRHVDHLFWRAVGRQQRQHPAGSSPAHLPVHREHQLGERGASRALRRQLGACL
jgi:hypothetical protein